MDPKERLRADIRRYKALSMMTSDKAATRVLNELIAESEAELARLVYAARGATLVRPEHTTTGRRAAR